MLGAVRHGQLCGGRGRRRALVGHEVQDRIVDLVANGADERLFAAEGCPGDHLRVEHPQVFPAAAAARHNDLVHIFALVQPADGVRHLLGRFKALHRHRAEQQLRGRPAAADDIADVLQRSTGLAGYDADALRKCRQRLFVLRVKKAFLGKFLLELFQCKLGRPHAVRKHCVDIQLECAVTLIQRCTAAHYDPHPLLRTERKPGSVRAEHHGLHAAGFVPQSEITVAAAGILHKVRDLAPQGQIKQHIIGVQTHFDITVQCGDRDHFSHSPASRAARIDTPMALSLEYCPGTK